MRFEKPRNYGICHDHLRQNVNRDLLKAFRDKFRVVDGRPVGEIPSHRIALSLVHPIERIDVAISAIEWIEPRQSKCYSRGKNLWIATRPFVEVRIVPYIRERIYRLSKKVIGDRLDIVIDGESVVRPIVYEPLGIQDCISISQNDYEDAVALADRLRTRWSRSEPRLVRRDLASSPD
jgi:hypothetical protein